MKSFSIVLETENLGMAEIDDLEASLDSLEGQNFPLEKSDGVYLIVGSHVSQKIQDYLRNKYKFIKIRKSDKSLEYTESKMLGASISKSQIVVYADSDMRYQKEWLENILKPFESRDRKLIVSGDTRLQTNSIYKASLNMTWMVQLLSENIKEPVDTYYFPLNNFAAYRTDILEYPIPSKVALYRNKIPLWEKILKSSGFKIVRAPHTRGFHAPPGNFLDWLYRMLAYGADFVRMADFSVTEEKTVKESRSFARRLWNLIFLVPWKIYRMAMNAFILFSEKPSDIVFIAPGIIMGVINIVIIGFGGLVALFAPNLIFTKITQRELGHGV